MEDRYTVANQDLTVAISHVLRDGERMTSGEVVRMLNEQRAALDNAAHEQEIDNATHLSWGDKVAALEAKLRSKEVELWGQSKNAACYLLRVAELEQEKSDYGLTQAKAACEGDTIWSEDDEPLCEECSAKARRRE